MSTVAVVTTFNPDLSVLREQLGRTVPQVKQLIVVDNGSVAADSIRALVEEFAKTRWFSLGENRGLGYAHNVGIQQALERGAGSVLILDQDTLPEPDMVSVLAPWSISRVQILSEVRPNMPPSIPVILQDIISPT